MHFVKDALRQESVFLVGYPSSKSSYSISACTFSQARAVCPLPAHLLSRLQLPASLRITQPTPRLPLNTKSFALQLDPLQLEHTPRQNSTSTSFR